MNNATNGHGSADISINGTIFVLFYGCVTFLCKSRDITLPTKVCLVKAMVFPGVMDGCESWTVKKAERRKIDAFETVVLQRTLESPLDCKEIQLVHPKGDQSWVFIGRTDAEAETPVLWPPHAKTGHI